MRQNSKRPGTQLMKVDQPQEQTQSSPGNTLSATDLYERLGIDSSSTLEEIHKAYRSLCKVHHPDAGGSQDDFNRLHEAYSILSNPESRQVYDVSGVIQDSVYRAQVNAMAVEKVRELVNQATMAIPDPTSVDLVADLIRGIAHVPKELDKTERAILQRKKKLGELLKRFKLKKRTGTDYVKDHLEKQLESCDAELQNVQKMRDVLKRTVEIFKGYEYEHEARPEDPMPRGFQTYRTVTINHSFD